MSRKSCARHVDQRDAPQEKNDNSNVYKLLRKSTVNDMLLQLEENARAFLEREADPRNLGSQGQCKDMVKPKGSRGDHSGYVQKVWLKEAMPKVHQKWIDQLPLHMKEHAVSLTKFREWLPFNTYGHTWPQCVTELAVYVSTMPLGPCLNKLMASFANLATGARKKGLARFSAR